MSGSPTTSSMAPERENGNPLMAEVVANFDEQGLLAIVAYLASRDP